MSEAERKEYFRAYYAANRERLRAYGKKWWDENKDAQNMVRRRQYRKKHLKRRQDDGLA